MRLCLLFCTLPLLASLGQSQLQGPQGPKGDREIIGLPGLPRGPGDSGLPGQKGQKGDRGYPGRQGQRGDRGLPGSPGQKGDRGPPGSPGQKGGFGPAGRSGQKGDRGYVGFPGQKGDRGFPGSAGKTGEKGEPGPPGPPGPAVTRGSYRSRQWHIDSTGSANSGCGELKKSVTKLELAINYDFVRKAGNKYFVSYKERNTFSKAVEFCSQRGLELALPQNEEENNILTQFFDTDYSAAWISVNNKTAEGNFETDMKNQVLTFTKWGEGQPDKSGGDTGCTIVSDTGAWKVIEECFIDAFIICEL